MDDTFLGRATQVERLRGYLAAMAQGKGGVVFVAGEEGMGKATLVRQAVAGQDLAYFEVRSNREDRERPFRPFMQILRLLDEQQTALPAVTAFQAALLGEGEVDLDSRHQLITAGLPQALAELGAAKPLVILLANFQTADLSSFQLIADGQASLAALPVILMVSYRPSELELWSGVHPLTEMLAEMMMDGTLQQVLVEPFTLGEVRELIGQILGGIQVDERFAQKILDVTNGNPGFLKELIGHLLTEGVIKAGANVGAGLIDQIEFPDSLRDSLKQRIARLEPGERAVLGCLAMLGTRAPLDLWAALCDLEPAALRSQLGPVLDSRIIYEDVGAGVETYCFAQDGLRDLMEAEVPDRPAQHRKAAEIIAAGELDDEAIYMLFRQWLGAEAFEQAFPAALRAADTAAAAPALAIGFLQQAIRLHDKVQEPGISLADLSNRKGALEFTTGDWSAAERSYEEAFADAADREDTEALARARTGTGDLAKYRSDYAACRSAYEQALGYDPQDVGIKSRALRGLAYSYWRRANLDAARPFLQQALRVSQEGGDIEAEAICHIDLGNLANLGGDLEQARELYGKALALLGSSGNLHEKSRATNNIGDIQLQIEDWAGALETFEACARIARQVGDRNMIAWSLFNRGEALAHLGRGEEALEHLAEAEPILEDLRDKNGLSGLRRARGIALLSLGRAEEALVALESSMELHLEMGAKDMQADTLIHLARALAALGRDAERTMTLQKALELAQEAKATAVIARVEQEKGGR